MVPPDTQGVMMTLQTDLQEAILYTYLHVRDDAGHGFVWTYPAPARAAEASGRLDAVLAAVTAVASGFDTADLQEARALLEELGH
jgi:hypothetical protein